MKKPSIGLRTCLWITDIGFIIYWSITALHILPTSLLFKDYDNPILVAWNWSFLPLDLLASIFGIAALIMADKRRPHWQYMALISSLLTMCAGLMALTFWTFRLDFDIGWWIPNIFLLVWPGFFIKSLLNGVAAN